MSFSHILEISLSKKMTGTNVFHMGFILAHRWFRKRKRKRTTIFLNFFNWIYAFLEYKETFCILNGKHKWVTFASCLEYEIYSFHHASHMGVYIIIIVIIIGRKKKKKTKTKHTKYITIYVVQPQTYIHGWK